jgi:hypothetical protein
LTDEPNGASDEFLGVLEEGVRAVLQNKKTKPSERIAAIAAGVKIAMVRYRISGDAEKGFFD